MLRLDNRDNARIVEMCYKDHTTLINPIIDWTTDEVWEFIKEYNIPYCCLYDEGFKRLGCIGCPMGSKEQRIAEFERYPKYKNLYMLAFQKMIDKRGGGGVLQDRRRSDARIHLGEIPTRRECDWANMNPEEIIDWWID